MPTAAARTRLPTVPPTPFGCDEEPSTLSRLVEDHPLVTQLGATGTGKPLLAHALLLRRT